MIVEIIIAMLIGIGLLNLWVTWRIAKDHLSTPVQRLTHGLAVWFVPIVGALLVLHLQRVNLEESNGTYPKTRELGDDHGYSQRLFGRPARGRDNDDQNLDD